MLSKKTSHTPNELTRTISIWLDEYDDIFSDFDSRPYSDRVLSDDFISEVTKVCHESKFNIKELKLLLPQKKRNEEVEKIISIRLDAFFKKNYKQFTLIKRKTIIKGLLMFTAGVCLLMIASYISVYKSTTLTLNILFVILEPTGWFMAWSSLDDLFYDIKKKKPELDFYTKMAKSKISFISIK